VGFLCVLFFGVLLFVVGLLLLFLVGFVSLLSFYDYFFNDFVVIMFIKITTAVVCHHHHYRRREFIGQNISAYFLVASLVANFKHLSNITTAMNRSLC
jgi:hypothetical protein